VLILAHAEMAKLNQELAPLIVARLFFSCLLRPVFTTCEASIPNFNAGTPTDPAPQFLVRVTFGFT
jgi:hypothetical protein